MTLQMLLEKKVFLPGFILVSPYLFKFSNAEHTNKPFNIPQYGGPLNFKHNRSNLSKARHIPKLSIRRMITAGTDKGK